MTGFLRRWSITWRGYSFGPARYGPMPPTPHQQIRAELHAEAERLYPPCSHEDGWCVCQPRGRHHAKAPEYGPPPIIATITDLPYDLPPPEDDRWRR